MYTDSDSSDDDDVGGGDIDDVFAYDICII